MKPPLHRIDRARPDPEGASLPTSMPQLTGRADAAESAARGCDGVVLGCTEIPLLVSPDDSVLPVLDSTRLLAHAAVEVAVGDRPRPTWRGGPYRE